MNPVERMKKLQEGFSAIEKKIFTKIASDPSYVTRSGIVGLSEWCGVSQPSITRFCKTVGYDKYVDFKQDMYQFILSDNTKVQTDDSRYSRLLQNHIEIFDSIDQSLSEDSIKTLVNEITSAQNVYFSGLAESGLIGELLNKKLSRLGIKSKTINPTELIDLFYYADSRDLLILFSARGNVKSNALGSFLSRTEKFEGRLVLVTMNKTITKGGKIDLVVQLPVAPNLESKSYSPTLTFTYFAENILSLVANALRSKL